MSTSRSLAFLLFFTLAATGCAQQAGSPGSPGQLGATAAVVPRDLIPYRFSGGSGSANFTAKGKDGSCSGTLKFEDNVVYVDVNSKGEVAPGTFSSAELIGSSTCQGNPFDLPEVFELKTGSIKDGKIADVIGKPPTDKIFGSFKMTGTVCDATVHLGRWVAEANGAHVSVNQVTITHLKKQLC